MTADDAKPSTNKPPSVLGVFIVATKPIAAGEPLLAATLDEDAPDARVRGTPPALRSAFVVRRHDLSIESDPELFGVARARAPASLVLSCHM